MVVLGERSGSSVRCAVGLVNHCDLDTGADLEGIALDGVHAGYLMTVDVLLMKGDERMSGFDAAADSDVEGSSVKPMASARKRANGAVVLST